jgi:hypothetical protein
MKKEVKAKREALQKFRKMIGSMGDAPVKATIIAKDEKGLRAGLEKAEEVLDSKMDEDHYDHDMDLDSMDADALRDYIKKHM